MVQRTWILSAALLLAAILGGCAPSTPSEVEDVPPEVRFENLRFEVLRGSTLEASGVLTRTSMRRDSSDLVASGIAVRFPPAAGREEARVTAARGTGNASKRWFQVEGGVQAVQGDEVVETERARFDGADRLVRGDAPVTVRGPAYVLDGPGFTLDPDDRTVRMDRGAALRIDTPAGAGK
jgi:hypothetical protein